jgi:methyl-accepting chemotaxis protein
MTMARHWTFGRKVGAGFAVTIFLALAMGMASVLALSNVVTSKNGVIEGSATLLAGAEKLRADLETKSAEFRGFLVTGDERYLESMRASRADFVSTALSLRRTVTTDQERALIDEVSRAEQQHQQLVEEIVTLRRSGTPASTVSQAFDTNVKPSRDQLDAAIASFVSREQELLSENNEAASRTASTASRLIVGLAVTSVLFAAAVAYLVTRTLGRQIGTAVSQVQSSSAELQSAASQQATGAKEEATAMAEITTTMNELLATSRQIADSAQRVSQIADQATANARAGGGTVEEARESVEGIRRQVDLIVDHMLGLGQKSQQIGAVLDIVSELAEQTNILAINATIEAASAGEFGARFAVVADEIRNLADRVAGSAKEIRDLIEEVRGAVNTTVMATETGSKTVDDGTRRFGAVSESLREIAELVTTTAEAAREIELSTKQQTTAVEQVNVAIVSVAQATRETEASSNETRQTATELATLSNDLLRLVRPQVNA